MSHRKAATFLVLVSALGVAGLPACGSEDDKKSGSAPRPSTGGADDGGAGSDAGGVDAGAAAGAPGEPGNAGNESGGRAGGAGEAATAVAGAGAAGGESGAAGGDFGGAGGESGSPSATFHLWVFDRNESRLYGYAPDQLRSTNGDAPAIELELTGIPRLVKTQLTFDARGDLWLSSLDTYRFAAEDLRQSGTAEVAAVLKGVGGNYAQVAFDPAGNLWRSSYTFPALSRFDAAAVATLSTTVTQLTPSFSSSGASVYPLTFDPVGNLFTGFFGTQGATTSPSFLGRYDAKQLVGTGSITDAPALSIAPRYDATDLARAPDGRIFLVNGTSQLISYSATQLDRAGLVQDLAPERTVTVDASGALALDHLAVDPDGNVYLSGTGSRVLKLDAASLTGAGAFTIAPAMTLRARASDAGAEFQAIAVR